MWSKRKKKSKLTYLNPNRSKIILYRNRLNIPGKPWLLDWEKKTPMYRALKAGISIRYRM